ncbi:MAG: hypothetical protein ABI837_05120, partial [Acidobacteriota bacterium]
MLIAVALLLAGMVPGKPEELKKIEQPFALLAPAPTVLSWQSFDVPGSGAGSIAVALEGGPVAAEARIDVFIWEQKSWVWSSTSGFSGDFRLAPLGSTRGVLVRSSRSPLYYWGEVEPGAWSAVRLRRYKTVRVDELVRGAVTLFISGEAEPRTLLAGVRSFALVPPVPAIACQTGSDSRCIELGAMSTSLGFADAPLGDARILRSQPQTDDQFRVLTKGHVAIRPKSVDSTILRANEWLAVLLRDSAVQWPDVVCDRSGAELALQRMEGATLPPLPAFTEVPTVRERGVVIRPWVGSNKQPLSDPAAMLVVFPDRASSVPLLTAPPETNGTFVLRELAPGATYFIQLLSSVTTSDRVEIVPMVGAPFDVVFPGGPMISGHVVRSSGGTAPDPVLLQAGAKMMMQEALKVDVLEKFRFTKADEDGKFTIVLASPGPYTLRAQWGSASAERDFEITKETRNLDLGDIVLKEGASLQGSVGQCTNGEA